MPGSKGFTPHVEDLEPGLGPTDVPAGGLDMPPPPPPLEVEAFPGESRLTEDERNRWLVLHFALPRTIVTSDIAESRSTEMELNDALAAMAWGTVDESGGEWILESEEPTLDPPHSSLISYAEYVARSYPADSSMEDKAREENVAMAAQKRAAFTSPGEPGAKFRPIFDQMVKNLAHSNKALMKAFDIKRVILKEEELPEDPSRPDDQAIMRFGRHQVLPAFWQLLIHLTKKNRRFSIVFRTFSPEQLGLLRRELQLFCQGKHPAYCGTNKTQKPPPMNGDKGSRDMRLTDQSIGGLDRMSGVLEFANRPANELKPPEPGESTDPSTGSMGPAFQPTKYSFPPMHEAYAGLMHHILDGANTAAIVDDFKYWQVKERDTLASKLLIVDDAGGMAETKVQHVFFDGYIRGGGDAYAVDVREAVTGEPVPYAQAEGVFFHRVNLFEAVTDTDYFVKALEGCERKMSERILASRRVAEEGAPSEPQATELAPKEYLYRNVIPALLPALEACQRDRPADPIEFIAFYMLRHPKQYSKSLKS